MAVHHSLWITSRSTRVAHTGRLIFVWRDKFNRLRSRQKMLVVVHLKTFHRCWSIAFAVIHHNEMLDRSKCLQ